MGEERGGEGGGGFRPLEGVRMVSLAVNIPGPVAAARLRALGASVAKVEPPGGDPLRLAVPEWYAELAEGQEVLALDLKEADGRATLERLLTDADLLLTSSRPAALARLGLGSAALHARHPGLSQVAITGYPPPEADQPGHDLTYQAGLGLVEPPALPRALLADLAAAERAVSAALALLLARRREPAGRIAYVAISAAAEAFAEPLRRGLTVPGGILGGGDPGYGLYRAREGWIAVAALEPHFRVRLADALGVDAADRAALERAFASRSADEWERWAAERDLPVVAVRGAG